MAIADVLCSRLPWSAFGTSMVPSRTTWLKDHIVPCSRSIHGQATAGVIRNSTTHASATVRTLYRIWCGIRSSCSL